MCYTVTSYIGLIPLQKLQLIQSYSEHLKCNSIDMLKNLIVVYLTNGNRKETHKFATIIKDLPALTNWLKEDNYKLGAIENITYY